MTRQDEMQGDFARLEIETPFSRDELEAFIQDPLRILRINPLMEFRKVEARSPGEWFLEGRNLANGREFEVTARHHPLEAGGWRLQWTGWLNSATELHPEPLPDGRSRLVIIDDYSGTTEKERKARLDEVDNSITHWGHALYRYLHNWKRWSWLPGWKWYFSGPWIRMKPSARRIAFMLIVITAMEFVLFLFAILILKLELA
jgi:hypothetical protein